MAPELINAFRATALSVVVALVLTSCVAADPTVPTTTAPGYSTTSVASTLERPGTATTSTPTSSVVQSTPSKLPDKVEERPGALYVGEPADVLPSVWVGVDGTSPGRDRIWVSDDRVLSEVAEVAVPGGNEDAPTRLVSINIGKSGQVLWVGRCCEPASGSLLTIDLTTTGRTAERTLDGLVTDANGGLRGVVSAAGDLAFFGEDRSELVEFFFGVGARSVAVDPNGIAVAITNDLSMQYGSKTPVGRLAIQWHWYGREGAGSREYELPDGFRACSVTWSYTGAAFVLERSNNFDEVDCLGSTLFSLDPATGVLGESGIPLDGMTSAISVDGSGTYVIYVTTAGQVRWKSLHDETGGVLSNGPFVAVDW